MNALRLPSWLVRWLVPPLRRLALAHPETRRELQRAGIAVAPAGFYSAQPTIDEIERSFEYSLAAQPPFLNEGLFVPDDLTRRLEELCAYAAEFDPPEHGDERECSRFFWRNSQFSYSDAIAYYCFLRLLRPAAVVEVGSGFSTLVAIEALRRNGTGRLVCIEPYPRPFLQRLPEIELLAVPAQSLDVDRYGELLGENGVLFIDSTHSVKTGSDCVYLYLRMLPRLGVDVVVHAHDVFLPFPMPREWLIEEQVTWTEQYLLLALLTDNPRAEVLFGSAYHLAANPELLQKLMGGKFPAGGGSLWFRYHAGAGVSRQAGATADLTAG